MPGSTVGNYNTVRMVRNGSSSFDGRLCLLLTALTGLLTWKAGAMALCLYLALIFLAFRVTRLEERMAAGTIRRTVLFALFWPLLKLTIDFLGLFPAVWEQLRGISDSGREQGVLPAIADIADIFGTLVCPDMAASFEQACLLFLRLLVIMGAALTLTLYLSPPALALAVGCLLRPLAGQRVWALALALAVMIRYLPRIYEISAQVRLAARARRLPCKGIAGARLAWPQVFRLLARDTWNQALAIASRRLDRPEVWLTPAPLDVRQAVAAFSLAAFIVGLACL